MALTWFVQGTGSGRGSSRGWLQAKRAVQWAIEPKVRKATEGGGYFGYSTPLSGISGSACSSQVGRPWPPGGAYPGEHSMASTPSGALARKMETLVRRSSPQRGFGYRHSRTPGWGVEQLAKVERLLRGPVETGCGLALLGSAALLLLLLLLSQLQLWQRSSPPPHPWNSTPPDPYFRVSAGLTVGGRPQDEYSCQGRQDWDSVVAVGLG